MCPKLQINAEGAIEISKKSEKTWNTKTVYEKSLNEMKDWEIERKGDK